MGTFNKWGHLWRKKYQWGEAFNQNGNCTFATDEMVQQDQNDSEPLELHISPKCRCQENGSTRFDVGVICLVENEIGPSGYHEPKLLNNFKVELEAKLPPGERMWPAFWLYSTSGVSGTTAYKYLEFDVFEGWSGPNGNYRVQSKKGKGCYTNVEEEASLLLQTIHGVNSKKKKKVFKNFQNEFEVPNLTTEFHKFSIERTDSKITIMCDNDVIISIGKSNFRWHKLQDPVYLIIGNGACNSKLVGDTSQSILYIRNLSIQEL